MKTCHSYDACLRTLRGQLGACPEVRLERIQQLPKTAASDAELRRLPPSVRDFYRESDGLLLRWTTPAATLHRPMGSVMILRLAEVLADWKDIVWFDWSAADDPMRGFHVIDWVSNHAFVGVFAGQTEDELFYFDGEDVVHLRLDMHGYVAMALFCRGLVGWQEAVLAVLDGRGAAAASIFHEAIGDQLRGFSAADFESAYAASRLCSRPSTARRSFAPHAA